MAVIYAEKAGIKFNLEDGSRVIAPAPASELSGLLYVIGSDYKKYPKNAEKIAQKTHKDRSYIIDENTVYYYKADELENFKADLSPYQLLINNFLEKKKIHGTVLLIDGNEDAVIISLIANKEFKQLLISNSKLINESLSEIKKYALKERVKIDRVVLNDDFYAPMFKNMPVSVIKDTEILEFAEQFQAPVFRKIEDIKRKIQKAKDKKLNLVLILSAFIFTINLGAYFYTAKINDEYRNLNNGLIFKIYNLKKKLNLEIEIKVLTLVRHNEALYVKNTLVKMSSVKNLKINSIIAGKTHFTITGQVEGGYRNFVMGYNKLKNIMRSYGLNYIVSQTGKVNFVLKGVIR